jgi:DNA gyrase/topoisomerase IV subunit B
MSQEIASAAACPDLGGAVIRSLVLYSLAEAQAGHVREIAMQVQGSSFEVSDDGRGHSIDKTIDGTPYLSFIYEHLAYPFGLCAPGAVQLQGLGISLINSLCEELQVRVRRGEQQATYCFAYGQLLQKTREPAPGLPSGNTLRGRLCAALAAHPIDQTALAQWIDDLRPSLPGVRIRFNEGWPS